MNRLSICGLVVHTRPERVAAVRDALLGFAGVEVHAANGDGRFVVTIEDPDYGRVADTLSGIRDITGVLDAALVYQFSGAIDQESDS